MHGREGPSWPVFMAYCRTGREPADDDTVWAHAQGISPAGRAACFVLPSMFGGRASA